MAVIVKSLLSFFAGVLLTAAIAAWALHERDVKWELEAYNRGYACFTTNFKDNSPLVFHWWNECKL